MASNLPTIKQELEGQFRSSTTVRQNEPVWVAHGKTEHLAVVLRVEDERVEIKWSTSGKKAWVSLSQCRSFIDLSAEETNAPRRSFRARTKTKHFLTETPKQPKQRRSSRKNPVIKKSRAALSHSVTPSKLADKLTPRKTSLAHRMATAGVPRRAAAPRPSNATKTMKLSQEDFPTDVKSVSRSEQQLCDERGERKENGCNVAAARVFNRGDDVWVQDGAANNLHAAKVLDVEDDEVHIRWSTYGRKEWVGKNRVQLQEVYVDLSNTPDQDVGAPRRSSRRSRVRTAFYQPSTQEPKKRGSKERNRRSIVKKETRNSEDQSNKVAPTLINGAKTRRRMKTVARKETVAARASAWEKRRQSFYPKLSTFEKRFDYREISPSVLTNLNEDSSSESSTSESTVTVTYPSPGAAAAETATTYKTKDSVVEKLEASSTWPTFSFNHGGRRKKERSESSDTADSLDVSKILSGIEDDNNSAPPTRRQTADTHELAGIFQDDDRLESRT